RTSVDRRQRGDLFELHVRARRFIVHQRDGLAAILRDVDRHELVAELARALRLEIAFVAANGPRVLLLAGHAVLDGFFPGLQSTRCGGLPASRRSCRAMDRSAPGRLMPAATSSTSAASMRARRTASENTGPPSFGRLKSFNAPPNFPNGLRTALTTTTSIRVE